MTKDELILAINNKTIYSASYDSKEESIDVEWDGDNFLSFPDSASNLSDIEGNYAAQDTDDFFSLFCLINRYVNTPIDQRNWVGATEYNFGQLKKKLKDMSRQTEQVLTGCHIDSSAGPTYELPNSGVMITLDDGTRLHSERLYSTFMSSDFQNKAIDFGNFIIPTAIIRSIQKCGDGDD